MMRATGIFVYAFLLILAILVAAGSARARNAAGDIVIAVVDDGPSVLDRITEEIEAELALLLPRGVKVEFREDAPYTIGWDVAEIGAALRGALGDAEVDYVMTTGLIGTYIASREEFPRSKPIVSSYPQPAELFDIPVSPEGRSLVHNLAFVVVPFRLDQDLSAFKEMFPIDTLHVAVDSEVVQEMENRKDRINQYVKQFGLHVELLPVHRDMSKNEGLFTPSVRYVLLGYMPRLTVPERRRYIELMNERRIPSFSYSGHLDVELGALAALTPDFTRQLVRRVAMNFSELQRGRSIAELPVVISVEGNLVINGKTAAEIGYKPSLEIRSYATIRHPEYLDAGARELTMKYVFQKAEEQNLSLIIKDTEVEASRRSVQISRSPMLPQILGRVSGQSLRNDWLTRTFPEETGSAGFTLQQMIYDDRIVSDYRSIKRLYDADLQQRETVRLNILDEAATAFLRYVLARALLKIEQDNYDLTADNLYLAKRRLEVGFSGKDEVFRWEAELAQRRIAVYRSEADVETERIALNQILALDQTIRWIPEEIDVDDKQFAFLDGQVTEVFRDADMFTKFRAFMVVLGFELSPELKVLGNAVEATEIQIGQRKRQFILPTFGVSVNYNYLFHRRPDVAGFDPSTNVLEVFALLPLFNGGGRYYDLQQIKANLSGLESERQLTHDRVERRVRSSIRLIESSFPSLAFSRSSADNAKKNLDVVQEKYAQGIVSVTDLIQAQNNAFVAGQLDVLTTYGFLLDLIKLQRAIAWFEEEKTQEETDLLVQRIREAAGF